MFTIWVILCQCGIFKICKKKKKTRTLSMLCFSVPCFFLIVLFSWEMIYTTSQSLIFLCFFFPGSTTSRPAVVREMNPPPPRKKLFSGQNKTRPRERRKSSLFFATESIFRPSDWYSPGRLKKKKARGARWEGERLLLALIGIPSRSLRWWERIIPVAPFSIVTIFRRDLVLIKSPSLAPSLRNMRHDTCNPRLFAIIWTF